MCSLFHNVKYAQDGDGIPVLDVLSTMLDMIGECVTTMLVLMLVNGWYTRFKKFDYDDGMEIYGPLFIMVLMIHVIMGAFSYIDQDAYHKYHDFSGWVGWVLIGAKLVLFAVYFWFYDYTRDKLNKDAMVFYKQFVPIGALYLLSDPVLIVSGFLLQEYNRQYYYRVADQLAHIGLQAYILW